MTFLPPLDELQPRELLIGVQAQLAIVLQSDLTLRRLVQPFQLAKQLTFMPPLQEVLVSMPRRPRRKELHLRMHYGSAAIARR